MTPFLRAVLFDVYGTLLDVGESPPDAERRWKDLCLRTFGEPPDRSLAEVAVKSRDLVAEKQSVTRRAGISFPEVDWPAVFKNVFPAARALDPPALSDFLFHHAALTRSVHLMAGAAEMLCWCRDAGIVCGIVSNAQQYTLRELREALESRRLDLGLFDTKLTFWSFENGFSKPDPHVFRILVARLARLGIPPEEALVIGDREDNDIQPAQAHGFQTFLFVPPPKGFGWPADFFAVKK